MISRTPITTIAALLTTFRTHDETAALPRLAHLPAFVACGSDDKITPVQHSLDLAAALPGAEFLQVPGAGHMLELERPQQVNAGLLRLVARAQNDRALAHA
jgi:pimeloyl-ACP methyl ester carboxylesterase